MNDKASSPFRVVLDLNSDLVRVVCTDDDDRSIRPVFESDIDLHRRPKDIIVDIETALDLGIKEGLLPIQEKEAVLACARESIAQAIRLSEDFKEPGRK